MKILLAYAFLQAVLPSYLATTLAPTDEHDLATLHRRGGAVQAISGRDGQVTRLRRRSPGISSSLGLSKDNLHTDSSSGDDNPPPGEQRTLRRRSNLRRRGDYSMLQRRSPLNRLQRRSPFFDGLFSSRDKENGAITTSDSDSENAPPAYQGPYGGVPPAYQGPYGGVPPANYQGGQSTSNPYI